MNIKVVGHGCVKCREAESLVKSVVEETGSSAIVEKVSDIKEMMALGVLSTPAIIIDGKIVLSGAVPTKESIRNWLTNGRR